MHKLRLTLLALGAVAAVTACTPDQIAKWVEWHQQDPAAAEAFANQPEVQANLHNDWDQDGVVEPEPSPEASGESLDESPEVEVEEVSGGSVWDDLAWCESGGAWSYNGSSGYDGGLQFLPSTWRAYGGGEFAQYAWQASRSAQITVAERVLDDVGWGAWPTCSRKLGLR